MVVLTSNERGIGSVVWQFFQHDLLRLLRSPGVQQRLCGPREVLLLAVSWACLGLFPHPAACLGAQEGGAPSAARTDTSPASEECSTLLLAGGDILDPVGERFRRADILIRSGTIDSISPEIPPPDGCKTMDVTGKFILPGFIDLHVHFFRSPLGPTTPASPEITAYEFLFCGVTSVQDLFSPPAEFFALRNGEASHPRVFGSGTLLTAAPSDGRKGWGTGFGYPAFEVAAKDDVAKAFSELLPFRPTVIKIALDAGPGQTHTVLDPSLLLAAVRLAHENGLLVAVHVRTIEQSLQAIDAGADQLAHVATDRPIPDDLLPRFRKVWVISTLASLEGASATKSQMRLLERGEPLLEQAVDPATLAAWKGSTSPCEQATLAPLRCEALRRAFAIAMENVRRLHAAGVRILAGTDAGGPNTFPGVSIHRELELLVASGLTPLEALRAATAEAGRALHRPPLGRLVVGAPADLLVLSANPLESISRTREIAAVISRGTLVPRSTLAEEIQREPPPRVPSAAIADFEEADALASWSVVTDEALGGSSRADLQIIEEENNHYLRIQGTLKPAGFFGFAAAQTPFGQKPAPGAPWDLSPYEAIVFLARGDGKICNVVFPTRDVPNRDFHRASFRAPARWTEIRIPLTSLEQAGIGGLPTPFSPNQVRALRFSVSPLPDQPPDSFRLELDQIRLVPRSTQSGR